MAYTNTMSELTQSYWKDQLEEGVIIIQNNRIIDINSAACIMLESSKAQAMGLPLIGVLREYRLEEAFIKQEKVDCFTRGRYLRASPFVNGLILKDVTAQKVAEENARELLAVLSHELRTPVTVIRSTLEALQEDLPNKLRERFMERALTESDRLVRLLEDLTVDVKPPQYRRIDLTEIVLRAKNLAQTVFAKHKVKLIEHVEPLTVWADSDKTLQVLLNLLENAAIHGPDSVAITLKISKDESAKFALISVQDEGEPLNLEPQELDRLFEPHSRGAGVKAKGTGLGLYIVRNIAQAWGGNAWVEPNEKGNDFKVTIPLKI